MAFSWLGHLMRNRRANAGLSVWNRGDLQSDARITVTSPSFADGGPIPQRHAANGVGLNLSPAFELSGVPIEADQLVFVLEDTDVPFARPLIHTVAIIDRDAAALAEGDLAATSARAAHVRGLGRIGYQGPRPIRGHGVHHYGFMFFAVAGDIDARSHRSVLESMARHVVGRGRLVGTYERD